MLGIFSENVLKFRAIIPEDILYILSQLKQLAPSMLCILAGNMKVVALRYSLDVPAAIPV